MALDYNDPVVGQELAKVQPMSFEEVEAELAAQGVRVSQAMNEMDVKLMCVEMRLRKTGQVGSQKNKKAPSKFSSKFEELVWTKPVFKEFYEEVKAKGDPNALNVVTEYINDKANAVKRYGKDYKALIRQTETALTAKPAVKTPTLAFSGFPANMGEQACRMTFGSIGAISDFSCAADDTFPVLKGKVTFESLDDAKKAVAKYDGMDMGMGTKLELKSV
jgi:RNA recognition motif. (a.k.a. RRM, RBD, or RNP domain)